ncbi:MAG: ATP-binding protein [Gemmatimonadota bacterium]|nr:ATP-binding protein [Gemmatimonadota bacterium]
MYIPRTLEDCIKSASRQFPVVLITGARQVGKTTLLRHAAEDSRTYVTLDDPMVLKLAREEPALFLQKFSPPLLIDEIQYAPNLLPYIKMHVDDNRRPGSFWLTGSQQFHMMKGVSESLAGRVGIFHLMGFSRREQAGQSAESYPFLPLPETVHARAGTGGKLPLPELYRLIWKGSFPAVALDDQKNWNWFYGSYVQTYLQRDIHDLARVGDEMAFLRFMRAVAARTGQLLNLSDLARDSDIAPNTAKSWLSILLASGIAFLLEPYHTNLTKRLVKAPKLYLLDTGLCAYLTEWFTPETLEAGAMSGAILETWIISELLKSYRHHGRRAPFYFFRDRDKKEIDLLIVQDGTVYPLEFKKTASPGKGNIKHFRLLEKLQMPIGPGGLICLYEKTLPLDATNMSIPVAVL